KARRAPSAAKAMVMAAPMPLAGPVITATRPASPKSIVISPLARSPAIGRSPFPLRETDSDCPYLEKFLRQGVSRRQECRREDLIDRRRARKTIGVDQDVDRSLEPRHVDIAEA